MRFPCSAIVPLSASRTHTTLLTILGSNAANNTSGDAFTLHIISTEENVFVTGGENTIRFWKFHASRKFLEFSDFLLSKYKRRINCMDVKKKIFCTLRELIINICQSVFNINKRYSPTKKIRFSTAVQIAAMC